MNEGINISFEFIVSTVGVGFMSLVGIIYRGITGKVKDLETDLKAHISDTREELKETNRELNRINTSLSRLVGRMEEEDDRRASQ